MFYIKGDIDGNVYSNLELYEKQALKRYEDLIDELFRLDGNGKIYLYEIPEEYLIDYLEECIEINVGECLERMFYLDEETNTWVDVVY